MWIPDLVFSSSWRLTYKWFFWADPGLSSRVLMAGICFLLRIESAVTGQAFNPYSDATPCDLAPIYPNHDGGCPPRKTGRHELRRRYSGKGEQFVLYSLRHTFLTRLGESGCDAWTLARITGHSNVSMSSRYVFILLRMPCSQPWQI